MGKSGVGGKRKAIKPLTAYDAGVKLGWELGINDFCTVLLKKGLLELTSRTIVLTARKMLKEGMKK